MASATETIVPGSRHAAEEQTFLGSCEGATGEGGSRILRKLLRTRSSNIYILSNLLLPEPA